MRERNIVTTVECYIKKGNKYLVLHRNKNKKIMPGVWMAPGGHCEFNEGLFECTRREIYEETGLKIKNLRVKVIGNSYLRDLDKEFYYHILFADYESGELKTNRADGEFSWLTIEEMGKLDNLLGEIKNLLPYLFDKPEEIISCKAIFSEGNTLEKFIIEKP